MKRLFGPLLVAALMAMSATGQTMLKYPWGQSLSVNATTQVATVRQHADEDSLVYNGDATYSTTGWSFGTSWTLSNDVFWCDGDEPGRLVQTGLNVREGQAYYVSFVVTNVAGGDLPGAGTSNHWVQASLGGFPSSRYTNSQDVALYLTCGYTDDRALAFAVTPGTNGVQVGVDNITVYPLDLAFGEEVTLYNAGSSAVYFGPNMPGDLFEKAYSNSTLPELPAGMTLDLPLRQSDEGWKFLTLRYRTAADETTTLKLITE